MSVFQVQLNNTQQGLLDLNPTGGSTVTNFLGNQMVPSIQRTVYIMGPNRINYELFDGQTFTDCNYWKQYAYPQVPLDQAFINVLVDDGSVYVPGGHNSYPYTFTLTPAISTGSFSGTGYATNNVANIMGITGSYAQFTQITNTGTVDLKVRINGLATSVFDLPVGGGQVFDTGDLQIAKVEFANASGSTAGAVQVLCTIASTCNS